MKTIRIADATLREVGSLSFKQKIEAVRQLESIKVDIIETALVSGEKADAVALHTISSTIKNAVHCCTTGLSEKAIDQAWDAIKGSAKPRLRIAAPVSSVQMEYLCHKKPAKMLELIAALIKHAVALCPDVEFAAEDATRADAEFLAEAVKTAIQFGAKTITICDTAGNALPGEFCDVLEELYKNVPALKKVHLSVQCNNALHLATASVLACCAFDINEIKTTIVCTSLPNLQDIVEILKAKGDTLEVSTKVNTLKIKNVVRTLGGFGGVEEAGEEETPAEDNGSVIEFDMSTPIATINRAVKKLGYDLSDEDKANVYEDFRRVACKKTVGKRDLEAIVANAALQVPPTYRLVSFVINNGNLITSTACVILEKDGEELKGVGYGDGPIDAALTTIENILGHHYELDDFQIQAVTKGRDSVGEALIKLRADGRLYSGAGISTDIVGASIRAYLNALNKIVYEE